MYKIKAVCMEYLNPMELEVPRDTKVLGAFTEDDNKPRIWLQYDNDSPVDSILKVTKYKSNGFGIYLEQDTKISSDMQHLVTIQEKTDASYTHYDEVIDNFIYEYTHIYYSLTKKD